MKNKILSVFLVVAILFSGFLAPSASAAVTVTPATGGENLPQGSGFVTLTNILITEGNAQDIGIGTHTFTLPSGWEFDTSSVINITTTSSSMVISPVSVTPGSTSFSFQIQAPAGSASDLAIKSVRVRPTATNSGNIIHSGANIAGVTGSTSFGSLSVQSSGGGGSSSSPSSSGGASGGGAPRIAPYDVFISINNREKTTDSREVTLRLSATYAGDMIIANDEPNFDFAVLESFNIVKNWTLSEGLGEKKVYVKFRSPTGFYTDPIEAVIELVGENQEAEDNNSVTENNEKEVTSFNEADLNQDGTVDLLDATALIPNWGKGGNPYDINQDGTTDIFDFNSVIKNWSGVDASNKRVSSVRDGEIILTPIRISTERGSLISVIASVKPGSSTVYTGRLVLDYPSNVLTLNNVSFASGWNALVVGQDNIQSSSVVIRTAGFPGGVNTTKPFATFTFLANGVGSSNISVNSGSVLMNENNHDVFSDNVAKVAVRVVEPVGSSVINSIEEDDIDSSLGEEVIELNQEDNSNLVATAFNFFKGVNVWIYLLILVVLAGLAYGATARQRSTSKKNTFDF